MSFARRKQIAHHSDLTLENHTGPTAAGLTARSAESFASRSEVWREAERQKAAQGGLLSLWRQGIPKSVGWTESATRCCSKRVPADGISMSNLKQAHVVSAVKALSHARLRNYRTFFRAADDRAAYGLCCWNEAVSSALGVCSLSPKLPSVTSSA